MRGQEAGTSVPSSGGAENQGGSGCPPHRELENWLECVCLGPGPAKKDQKEWPRKKAMFLFRGCQGLGLRALTVSPSSQLWSIHSSSLHFLLCQLLPCGNPGAPYYHHACFTGRKWKLREVQSFAQVLGSVGVHLGFEPRSFQIPHCTFSLSDSIRPCPMRRRPSSSWSILLPWAQSTFLQEFPWPQQPV